MYDLNTQESETTKQVPLEVVYGQQARGNFFQVAELEWWWMTQMWKTSSEIMLSHHLSLLDCVSRWRRCMATRCGDA